MLNKEATRLEFIVGTLLGSGLVCLVVEAGSVAGGCLNVQPFLLLSQSNTGDHLLSIENISRDLPLSLKINRIRKDGFRHSRPAEEWAWVRCR